MPAQVTQPLISIGMPLYNEEKYLNETFKCLLDQDYKNIEFVISDNASQDRTREICLEYAAKDSRIRYTRIESTMDASKNMNRTVELSEGEYFMWAAGHDRYAPNYVSACLEALLRDPMAVLCYTDLLPITAEGKPLGVLPTPMSTQGILGPIVRYLLVFWNLGGLQPYGLFQMETLKKTHLFPHETIGPDFILLPELALFGTFAIVRKPLYMPRMKWTDEKTFDATLERYSKMMFLHGNTPRFPHWRLFREQIRSVLRSKLIGRRRLLLLSLLIPSFISKYRRQLAEDVFRVMT